MKITKILKKIISFILLVTFLTSNNVYPYPIKTELRPPLQVSSEHINRLVEALDRVKKDKAISPFASNHTAFTDEQKKAILKEIEKYCGGSIQNAKESLEELEQSGVITPQNRETILTTLKEIPQHVESGTWSAYNSLIALLQSNLITGTNQEKVLKDFIAILKEISQYSGKNTWRAHDSLIALLESCLITKTDKEEVFSILKEIPQYAKTDTHNAYNSLLGVLKLMKQKNLVLDQDILSIILDMIKDGGDDSGVKDTLNAIKDFISTNAQDPEAEEGQGFSNNLSALLSPIPRQLPAVNIIKGTSGLTKTYRSGL